MDSVQTLHPAVFDSASQLLADAFFDNPAHVYICPNSGERRSQLQWLLGGNLAIQPDLTRSFCLVEQDVVKAMGFWTQSNATKPETIDETRAALKQAPWRLGLIGMRRLREVMSGIDEQLYEALGEKPYWYLNNMVVAEPLRGRGVGKKLLGKQLADIEEQQPGLPVALTTQRYRNVLFYRQFGFEPVVERSIGSGSEKFINWVMVRPRAGYDL